MTALTSNPSIQALAWALVHFLWQGAAIGAAIFFWLRLRRPSAQARYAAGILALAVLLAAPVATFLWLATPAPGDRVTVVEWTEPAEPAAPVTDRTDLAFSNATPAPPVANADPSARPETSVREAAAAAIVAVWAIGVLLLSLRLAGGWILARRLVVRGSTPASAELSTLAEKLALRLGLTRAIRIVESSAVSVPVLVGWLKPVVLLPASALSGLSTGQIEALIAHELAHVRRHDYIVNILQSIVETLLFYHPAVWLISREVREAREHCCDDVAIGVCDRVVYVTALADLAHINHTPRIALAATGGSLLHRVQRLLGPPPSHGDPGAAWLGVLSLALVLGVMPSAVDSEAAPETAMTGDVAGGPVESGRHDVLGDRDAAGVVDSGAGGIDGDVAALAERATSQTSSERQDPLRQLEEVSRLQQSEADIQAAQQRTEEEMRALGQRLAALERQLAATQVSRQEPDSVAPDTGLRTTTRLEARAVRVIADVNAARSELERNRQLFEVGVLPTSTMREYEARVAAAERELAALAVEIQLTADEAATRSAIDERRTRLQWQAEIGQTEAELISARQSLETVRQRVDAGVAGREELVDAEARLVAIERRLDRAGREFQIMQEEAALEQRRIDVLRRLLGEMRDAGARDPLLTPIPPRLDAAPVTDPAARVQPGDILSIAVEGEPDLPATYTVDADGTIRLPLVGSIEVRGLTALQARDAVVASLRQRGLAEGRAVTVTLGRQQ